MAQGEATTFLGRHRPRERGREIGYSVEGTSVREEALAHRTLVRFKHVNPHGKSVFRLDQASQRQGPRSLWVK
jgi:hypothetical protein